MNIPRIISVFNQKGGVGKTTTVINLGAALSAVGQKVLLIDLDPQANATSGVGIDDEELTNSIYQLLTAKKVTKEQIQAVIQETPYVGLNVLPADITLSDAEITLANLMSREKVLSRIVKLVEDEYDYILIDCPPSLGLLSVNALVASDGVLIPVSPAYFSIKGIKHLMNTIGLIQENLKPELEIIGVLMTQYDSRKKIAKQIKCSLKEVFGEKVLNTVIRVNSEIEYSQDNQVPIIFYNKKSNGYADYTELALEVMENGK